jgi:hypothetical protein
MRNDKAVAKIVSLANLLDNIHFLSFMLPANYPPPAAQDIAFCGSQLFSGAFAW